MYSTYKCYGSVSFWYGSGSEPNLKSRKMLTFLKLFFSIKKYISPKKWSVLWFMGQIFMYINQKFIIFEDLIFLIWYILMIVVDFCGNFPWLWLIFCYLDPDPADQNETDLDWHILITIVIYSCNRFDKSLVMQTYVCVTQHTHYVHNNESCKLWRTFVRQICCSLRGLTRSVRNTPAAVSFIFFMTVGSKACLDLRRIVAKTNNAQGSKIQ